MWGAAEVLPTVTARHSDNRIYILAIGKCSAVFCKFREIRLRF